MATVSPPAAPLLGMYEEDSSGTALFPGAPSAWPSGSQTNIIAGYFAMDSGDQFSTYGTPFIQECKTNGLIPYVEIEPWDYDKTPVAFSAITGGTWDTYFQQCGQAIAAAGTKVLLTFGHEFNVAQQYPWAYLATESGLTGAGPSGGDVTPAEWQAAWKYVHDKVNSFANGFALWMWAPGANTGGSSTTSPTPWWPGASYVDMVGVDAYEGLDGGPTNFNSMLSSTLTDIRNLGWTDDVFIAETNLALMVSSGGDSIATFVSDMHNAGISGMLEFEVNGLSPMSPTQWTQYHTAVAAIDWGSGGGGSPPPTVDKFDTLTDAFTGSTLSSVWTSIGDGTVTVSGGELNLPCTPLNGQIQTVAAYDLTSSHVAFKVTPFIGTDSSEYATQILLGSQDGTGGYVMAYDGGSLVAYSLVGGVGTTTYATVAYNATAMAYFKVSESGGTITFAYSADGSTFTTLATTTDETIVAPTSMFATIGAGSGSTGQSGVSHIADFNTAPSGGGDGGDPGGGGSGASFWYDNIGIAGMNAKAALLNGGSIKVYTGSKPALNVAPTGTLLVTLTFGSPAFATATAADGTVTATANAITSGTAGNSGTAGYFALETSAGVPSLTGDVGVTGSGADMELSVVAITSGIPVSCSEFALTQSETGS